MVLVDGDDGSGLIFRTEGNGVVSPSRVPSGSVFVGKASVPVLRPGVKEAAKIHADNLKTSHISPHGYLSSLGSLRCLSLPR